MTIPAEVRATIEAALKPRREFFASELRNWYDAHPDRSAWQNEVDAIDAALAWLAEQGQPDAIEARDKIRAGLVKGRIRLPQRREPDAYAPLFIDALEVATVEDLQWAMAFLIRRKKNVTFRSRRMKAIGDRMIDVLNEQSRP